MARQRMELCVCCWYEIPFGIRNRADSDTSKDRHRLIEPGAPTICRGCYNNLEYLKAQLGLTTRAQALLEHYRRKGWPIRAWLRKMVRDSLERSDAKPRPRQLSAPRATSHLHLVPRRREAA